MPTILTSDALCPFQPISLAKDHLNRVFMANGLDPVKIWNPFRNTDALLSAGLEAPTNGSFAGNWSGAGSITGTYYFAVVYEDADGWRGVLGDLLSDAAVTNDTITYTDIPVPTESRITAKYIFRSLANDPSVLYKDLTLAVNTTTDTSTKSDATLSANEKLPILNADGTLNARRQVRPPATKSIVVAHKDRLWLAGDVFYDQGHVRTTQTSTQVGGRGTQFPADMRNRVFYVRGHNAPFLVNSVTDTANQTFDLDGAWGSATDLFVHYSIAAAANTINRIYFSELLEPEYWPIAQNYLTISDDVGQDDLITGLMPHGNYLYILKERHIYRLSYTTRPNTAGSDVYLVASRGCINQRCWVQVEDVLYLLDFDGVYAFNGGSVQPISLPIQDYFRDRKINWGARRWFHAAKDAREEVVRFFVATGSSYLPKDCLCFNYRLNRWWTEPMPFYIGASCQAIINGESVPVYGAPPNTSGPRVVTPHGTLDSGNALIPATASTRGTVTSSALLSITDSSVTQPSGAVNSTVTIVAGRGKGQTRQVLSVSGGTINVKTPWRIKPDTTSVYQLGGVPWSGRLGKFEFLPAAGGRDQQRRATISFKPTKQAASFDVRRYLSHESEPQDLEVSRTAVLLSTTRGEPDYVVDMKHNRTEGGPTSKSPGVQMIDFSEGTDPLLPGDRSMSLELRGCQGVDPVVIGKISLEGVK